MRNLCLALLTILALGCSRQPLAKQLYQPPAGTQSPPMRLADVQTAYRSGLGDAEVLDDLRARGFSGGASDEQLGELRRAGAGAGVTDALRKGDFTVSDSYAGKLIGQAQQAAAGYASQQRAAQRADEAERQRLSSLQQQSLQQGSMNGASTAPAPNRTAYPSKAGGSSNSNENLSNAEKESRMRAFYNLHGRYPTKKDIW